MKKVLTTLLLCTIIAACSPAPVGVEQIKVAENYCKERNSRLESVSSVNISLTLRQSRNDRTSFYCEDIPTEIILNQIKKDVDKGN